MKKKGGSDTRIVRQFLEVRSSVDQFISNKIRFGKG